MKNVDELKDQREYAWKYFALHAEQRLKTFHFFIILSAILSGAIFTIMKDVSNIVYAIPMCYLISFLAFIFWKLDQRNKELIKHSENVLKSIETCFELQCDNIPNLFKDEGKKNNKNKFFIPLINSRWSYSNCFNWIFFIFGISGFISASLLLIKIL